MERTVGPPLGSVDHRVAVLGRESLDQLRSEEVFRLDGEALPLGPEGGAVGDHLLLGEPERASHQGVLGLAPGLVVVGDHHDRKVEGRLGDDGLGDHLDGPVRRSEAKSIQQVLLPDDPGRQLEAELVALAFDEDHCSGTCGHLRDRLEERLQRDGAE